MHRVNIVGKSATASKPMLRDFSRCQALGECRKIGVTPRAGHHSAQASAIPLMLDEYLCALISFTLHIAQLIGLKHRFVFSLHNGFWIFQNVRWHRPREKRRECKYQMQRGNNPTASNVTESD
jgi:hypothetical protein